MNVLYASLATALWYTTFPRVGEVRGGRGARYFRASIVLPDPDPLCMIVRWCHGPGGPRHSTGSAAKKCADRRMVEAWT